MEDFGVDRAAAVTTGQVLVWGGALGLGFRV